MFQLELDAPVTSGLPVLHLPTQASARQPSQTEVHAADNTARRVKELGQASTNLQAQVRICTCWSPCGKLAVLVSLSTSWACWVSRGVVFEIPDTLQCDRGPFPQLGV